MNKITQEKKESLKYNCLKNGNEISRNGFDHLLWYYRKAKYQ